MGETAGGVNTQPHPNHASQRHAAERERRNLERISESENVPAELLDCVIACNDRRSAVASRVEAEDPEVRRQRLDLRLPHSVIETEAMREHDDRLALSALEPVVQIAERSMYE